MREVEFDEKYMEQEILDRFTARDVAGRVQGVGMIAKPFLPTGRLQPVVGEEFRESNTVGHELSDACSFLDFSSTPRASFSL